MRLLDIDTRVIQAPESRRNLTAIEVARVLALDENGEPVPYDRSTTYERTDDYVPGEPYTYSTYWHFCGEGVRWITDHDNATDARKLAAILAKRYGVSVVDRTTKEEE